MRKKHTFIHRNARPLDLARWRFHFEGGSADEVLAEPSFYQNAAVGINVSFYRSTAEAGQEIEMPNGWYDDSRQTIYLDLNAGANEGGQQMVEYAIMQTAAHELTHYIERGSAQGYIQLKNLVRKRLEEQGKDYMQLVLDKVRKSNVPLTRAGAEAEVIADASELMLRDTKAISEIAKTNKSLASRITQFIRDFARRVKRAIGSFMPTTKESAALTEMRNGVLTYVDGLQTAWDNALIEAAGRGNAETTVPQESLRETMVEDVQAQTKAQAVEAMSSGENAPMDAQTAGNVAEEVVEAAVDAAMENGATLAQKLESDGLEAMATGIRNRVQEKYGAEGGAVAYFAAVQAAGEVMDVADVRAAVENTMTELAEWSMSADNVAHPIAPEQLQDMVNMIVPAMEEAAKGFTWAGQTGETLLESAVAAAKQAAQDVYQGGSETVSNALNQLAESAAAEAVDSLAFEQAVDAAQRRQEAKKNPYVVEVRYSLRDTAKMSWEEQVERVRNKEIRSSATLSIGRYPAVSDVFGMDNVQYGMDIGDLRKVMREKRGSRSAHELGDAVKDVFPQTLASPIAVFENAERSSLYFIGYDDSSNTPVALIVLPNQSDPVGEAMHRVITAYPIQGDFKTYLDNQLPEGSRVWINKKEALAQILAGRQITSAAHAHEGWNATNVEDHIHNLSENFTEIVARNEDAVNNNLQFSERKANATEFAKLAEEHFGTTWDWRETGWLTINGARLDFSGKKDGASRGQRSMDHREILEIYEENDIPVDSGTGAMIDFMQQGNIRISPESDGINLSTAPNAKQKTALRQFISAKNGEIIVDIDNEYGDTVASVEYPAKTSSVKIFRDIEKYFEDGTIPEADEMSKFRYSQRRKTAPSFRQAMMDMAITDDMTALEKELLTKYKGYVREYTEKKEQINALVEVMKGEQSRDEEIKNTNRMGVLKSQQRRVEQRLYDAEKRGGFANLMVDAHQPICMQLASNKNRAESFIDGDSARFLMPLSGRCARTASGRSRRTPRRNRPP